MFGEGDALTQVRTRLVWKPAVFLRNLTVLLCLLTLLALAATAWPVRAENRGGETHTVQPGDTLWDIALRIGSPTQDIRRLVFEITQLNGLTDAQLKPGQVLRLPTR